MTLYLSSLRLGLKSLRHMKVRDTYSVHRVVYGLFEKRMENGSQVELGSRVLYAEVAGSPVERRFLVLSDRMPAPRDEGVLLQTKEIPEDFLMHDSYRFQVWVNPLVRRERDDSGDGVPQFLLGRQEIGVWFCGKASGWNLSPGWGFSVDPSCLDVREVKVDSFLCKGSRRVKVVKALVTGVLQVTDRESFVRSVSLGIGRAKAWGCGLLQLVPMD